MNMVIVAFDIDGTLRCSCTDTCRRVNEDVLQEASSMSLTQNTLVMAWSAGGAQSAQSFIDSDERLQSIFGNRCHSKLAYIQKYGKPDIAYDDMADFTMGKVNVIVNPTSHE